MKIIPAGADLGGGGRTPPPPSGIRLPADPKGSPLCTILRYPNLVTDPKNFLKAPLAPIYTYFEVGARAKKRNFFGQNVLKSAQKCRFWPVFQNFACSARKFDQNRVFLMLWESSENHFGRPKKKVDKIFKNFLKSAPPPPSRKS